MSQKLKITPKSQRTKRALEERAPKIHENTKKCLLLKGPKSSQIAQTILKDLHSLKKPDSKMLQKKNMTRPFEDPGSVEFLGKQNDCSLFAYVSHSKKRPHNLVLGRTFDHQLLDMFEFAVDEPSFKSMADFETARQATVRIGGKPMFVFKGDFETDPELEKVRNLFLDFFRGEVLDKINLAALDRVIVLTAHKKKLYFRHYGVIMKKSGSKYPKPDLQLVGPSMDLTIRRSKSAKEEIHKKANQQPRLGPSAKKRKNMIDGQLGDKLGKLHMQKEDFDKIHIAKMKGLKKRKQADMVPEDDEASDASVD